MMTGNTKIKWAEWSQKSKILDKYGVKTENV